MDLLLPLVLELATVIFCIKFLISKLKKTWQLLTNTANTQAALNAGSSEKAKELTDKPRASDPAATAPGGIQSPAYAGMPGESSDMMGTGMIPDMRGTTGDTAGLGGMPVGGAVGVAGIANAVMIGPQSGNIHNAMVAQRQIIGPVKQTGMMYNIKPKGFKEIGNQNAEVITNQINGKITINQVGSRGATTNITAGSKISRLEAGKSTFNTKGETKIEAPRGTIHTKESSEIIAPRSKVYRITGVSQASQLDKTFSGSKQEIERAKAYNEGRLPEKEEHYIRKIEQGKKIAYLQIEQERRRREGLPLGGNGYREARVVYESQQGRPLSTRYVEIERVPRNVGMVNLTEEQKVKLAELDRLIKIDKAIQHNDNESFMRSFVRNDDNELSRIVVLMAPKEMTPRDMKFIFDRAKEVKELDQKVAIADETRQRVDDSNIEALNQILQETTVSKKFDRYLEKNMDMENNTLLSKDDIERIRQQAIENVERDKNLTLEEREERLRELEEKMKKDLGKERLKQQIIDNPEGAEEVIGSKAVKDLMKAIENNEKNMAKIYEEVQKEFKKMDRDNYAEGHEKRKATDFESYKQRRQQNNLNAVQTAMGEYENSSLPSQIHTAEEYSHMNSVS